MILASILELTQDHKEKRRIYDDFPFIFILNLKLFRIQQRHVGSMSGYKALRSRDIIWAFHSI